MKALTNASGVTEDQAMICVLYALHTHREEVDRIPILAVIGMTGTGKSALISQLQYMVKEPKRKSASSYPTMRDEMANCPTYLIDEGDHLSETLLQTRTVKEDSIVTHNVQTKDGWKKKETDVFGATILARRNPFKDAAVRNRAIVIKTNANPGDYHITSIENLSDVLKGTLIEPVNLGEGRIQDTWAPLVEIAKRIDDRRWFEAVERFIEAELDIFASGQDYELEKVVLHALDSATWDPIGHRIENDVELADVAKEASDIGDVKLKKKTVEETLLNLGFRVTYTHGVRYVRANLGLLEELLEG